MVQRTAPGFGRVQHNRPDVFGAPRHAWRRHSRQLYGSGHLWRVRFRADVRHGLGTELTSASCCRIIAVQCLHSLWGRRKRFQRKLRWPTPVTRAPGYRAELHALWGQRPQLGRTDSRIGFYVPRVPPVWFREEPILGFDSVLASTDSGAKPAQRVGPWHFSRCLSCFAWAALRKKGPQRVSTTARFTSFLGQTRLAMVRSIFTWNDLRHVWMELGSRGSGHSNALSSDWGSVHNPVSRPMQTPLPALTALSLATNLSLAQGTFVNLNFEKADLSAYGAGPAVVPASSGVPGWTPTGLLGQDNVLYNGLALGNTTVSILSRKGPYAVIDGMYSIELYGGGGIPTGASISQASLVPVDAASILFKAQVLGAGGRNAFGFFGRPECAILRCLHRC